MKIITEKPTNLKQENIDLDMRLSAVSENISNKIKYYFKTPNEKYNNPLTSSHEVGWFNDDKLNKNQRRHPRIGCDVTRYADEYYYLKGRSPFATREVKKEAK